uniref:Uncharacterized protein n=1 Tax=Romanomermis culicivorax TaxID=13658 RepID=A0A915HH38_ROMCU
MPTLNCLLANECQHLDATPESQDYSIFRKDGSKASTEDVTSQVGRLLTCNMCNRIMQKPCICQQCHNVIGCQECSERAHQCLQLEVLMPLQLEVLMPNVPLVLLITFDYESQIRFFEMRSLFMTRARFSKRTVTFRAMRHCAKTNPFLALSLINT